MAATGREPIFRPIFGADWARLQPVMLSHYANRPFCGDVVTVEGVMAVTMAPLVRLMAPILRLTRTLVPMAGEGIPVTVRFESEPDGPAFRFDRIFRFPGRAPWHFRSRLEPVGGDEVVEWMASGIGWRASFRFTDGRVRLDHRGYCIRILGRVVPLPLGLLFGRGWAEEEAVDDESFRMRMEIRHPLLGVLYGYSGLFRVTEMRLDG